MRRLFLLFPVAISACAGPPSPDPRTAALGAEVRNLRAEGDAVAEWHRQQITSVRARVPEVIALCDATFPRPRGQSNENRALVLRGCAREKIGAEMERIEAEFDRRMTALERRHERVVDQNQQAEWDRAAAEARRDAVLFAPGSPLNPTNVRVVR